MIPPRADFSQSSFKKINFNNTPKDLVHVIEEEDSRRVRFSQNDEVFEIPHINDLSDEEVDDVWLSPDDFQSIRRECRKIIIAVQRGWTKALEDIELRGLEHHMLGQREQIETIQGILYGTVEKLQNFNYETQVDVSDTMKDMLQKISSRSRKEARQMALRDEAEAKKV